jgi:hypothetical protein
MCGKLTICRAAREETRGTCSTECCSCECEEQAAVAEAGALGQELKLNVRQAGDLQSSQGTQTQETIGYGTIVP